MPDNTNEPSLRVKDDGNELLEKFRDLLENVTHLAPLSLRSSHVDVEITCEKKKCVAKPATITVKRGQYVRFHARKTNAHVYFPDPTVTTNPNPYLVIPAGQFRVLQIARWAKTGAPGYAYVVFCEACGLACPGGGGNEPRMIIE